MDRERLTEVFRIAGASDPASWARSEIEEDIPQLARFLFLRGAWSRIVREGDTTWIEAQRRGVRDPNEPYAGIGAALERLVAKGIDPADLTEVVRVMQYDLLHGICYLLSDPYPAMEGIENPPPELEDVDWQLFEVGADGEPRRAISALHESVLEMDPTGREMRPRAR